MSIHIGAEKGEIAECVLLPGDPCRARFIAGQYLENYSCHNEIRGMLGFTGVYQGKCISVQSTGMGIPSFSIYAEELIRDYGCKILIRVGSCGSIQENVHINDLILAMGACTDSRINNLVFQGSDFAPVADFGLLRKAFDLAGQQGIEAKVGSVMTSDTFYNIKDDCYEIWKRHGVLAYEMETATLYTIAARHGVRGLSILTVSDHILTGDSLSPKDREQSFHQMFELALHTAVQAD